VAEKFALPLDSSRIHSVFAPGELATDVAGGELPSAWRELLPESLALYARLEAAADLPAREVAMPGQREESATLDLLLRDLREARMTPESSTESSAGSGPGPEIDSRWTVVERRFLGTVLSELVERRKAIAALEAGLEDAVDRRDELAATLHTIESSRAFRLASAAWRVAAWLRRLRRLRGEPGSGNDAD
jgi:hypothetical protein